MLPRKDSALEYLRGTLKSLERHAKSQAILTYVPWESQKAFHCANAMERALYGPNGEGKSFAGGWETAAHALNIYPDWFPKYNRIKEERRPAMIRVGAETFQQVEQNMISQLRKWITDEQVAVWHRNPQGHIQGMELTNGTIIDCITYMQPTERQEGWTGDFVWWDEPPPEDTHAASLRGVVRREGQVIFTLTPLKNQSAWISKKFWYDLEDPDILALPERIRPFKSLIPAGANKTFSELGRMAWKSHLMKYSPEDMAMARLEGMPFSEFSRVYKQWDRHKHTCDPFKMRLEDWTLFFGIDPHDKKPNAQVWIAVGRPGKNMVCPKVVIWEDYSKQRNIPDNVAYIRHVEQERLQEILGQPVKARMRFMDPRFGSTTYGNTGKTAIFEYKEAGRNLGYPMAFKTPVESIEAGHSIIRSWLNGVVTYDDGTSVPEFRVTRNCKKLIEALTQYAYNKDSEKAEEEYKDLPDALRYPALGRLVFHEEHLEEESWDNDKERLDALWEKRKKDLEKERYLRLGIPYEPPGEDDLETEDQTLEVLSQPL